MAEAEEWRPVYGWEELYEVSGSGQVRSLPRMTPHGIRGGHVMTWYLNDGEPQVRLYRNGSMTRRYVHHLVLEAFTSLRPRGHIAKHVSGDRLDCSAGNLTWVRQPMPSRWAARVP